jgi:hypothetical protein
VRAAFLRWRDVGGRPDRHLTPNSVWHYQASGKQNMNILVNNFRVLLARAD